MLFQYLPINYIPTCFKTQGAVVDFNWRGKQVSPLELNKGLAYS